jgi:excisionase family DNA binding protein
MFWMGSSSMSIEGDIRSIVHEELAAQLAQHFEAMKRLVEANRAVAPVVESEPLLTVEQAAGLLQVKPTTIRRWLANGVLTHHGTDRVVRIDRTELLALRPGQIEKTPDAPANVTDIVARMLKPGDKITARGGR